MSTEVRALDIILSEMRSELEQSTSKMQTETFEDLWKKDKERYETSAKQDQFPRKILEGDLGRLASKHYRYIRDIYLMHHAKVWQAESEANGDKDAVSRYEEAEADFANDIHLHEDAVKATEDVIEILDLEAARMFANSTKKMVSYENMAFQLLTADTDDDYGLLGPLAKGMGNRFIQSGVGSHEKRLKFIMLYFDLDSAEFAKDLTPEQAAELKETLHKGPYGNSAVQVADISALIDDYIISYVPKPGALALRREDSLDDLRKVFGERYAQMNPGLAVNLQKAIAILGNLEHAEDALVPDGEIKFIILNYLHETVHGGGMSMMDIPLEGKDESVRRASMRKEIRKAARANLRTYYFADSAYNHDLIDQALLKLMNGKGM
jgi:hypothetical protein